MTIAGLKIVSCPFCKQLYKNRIIGSYNTFNSSYFSDGHLEGDWIPEMLSIIKCINNDCGNFFNIEEAKVIAELDKNDFNAPEWKDAHYLAGYKIGIKELEEVLSINYCKNEQEEISIRTLLLRRYNDVFRKDKKHKYTSVEKENFIGNIERLIELYKNETTAAGKLFLAELYREKGDYDLCLQVLIGISNEKEDEKQFKVKIYSKAKLKDDRVFNVTTLAPKMEYKCNNCGDSLILFDLNKINSPLNYKHYKCRTENKIFNSSSNEKNPDRYYKLSAWQKLFKTKEAYKDIIPKNVIKCSNCDGKDVEEFNPENQNCIKCGQGNYDVVKWFE